MAKDRPLRPVDEALKALDSEFNALYVDLGRDSIPPERLLRTQLLMALYTIRSEPQLVEQIDYNLLFRWFVSFSMDDEVWHHSTFTKNRDRLLEGEVAHKFFAQVLKQARGADLLSKEHFSVDGTLIEALASLKSYRPKDEDEPPTQGGGAIPQWTFVVRSAAGTPMNRRPHRMRYCSVKSKGTTTKLSYLGHLVDGEPLWAAGSRRPCDSGAIETAERKAAIAMVGALAGTHRVTVGADKNCDTKGFVEAMRCANTTPHVAQNDATVHRPSMDTPPATPVTEPARRSGSRSKNASAGSRSSAGCAKAGL